MEQNRLLEYKQGVKCPDGTFENKRTSVMKLPDCFSLTKGFLERPQYVENLTLPQCQTVDRSVRLHCELW